MGMILAAAFSNSTASAQVPGAIISAGALGGYQSTSRADMGSGDYYSIRGSFTSLFAELRHTDWGNASNGIHENGLLAGADISLLHIMFSGAVGIGSCKYQAASVGGSETGPELIPPPVSYNSLIYEAQAMYQFDIVAGMITAGIGVNYTAESNNTAPISGWGGVASVSVGL